MVFRNTVYVLECEDDKYYVGSTSNRKQRYRQHFAKRGGSTWTRLHKPIRVIDEYKRIPSRYLMGMEAQKTAEYMMKYGVNNVRGAGYCTSREFTIDNAADLTTFLGHYNQLSYRDLRRQLREVLPEPDSSTSSSQSARYSGQFPKSKAESSNNNVNGRYRNNLISNEEREEAITRQQIRKDKRKRRRKRKRHALGKDEATCDKCGQKDDWNCCPSDDNQANFSDQVEWRVQFEEN
jgi:predicted GIY-YIG superfamily endonuclease